ncbi:winged helix-turn-helix domain-containing protein [Paraglaciecola hydrolytica]|uniref:OmpR/PhoB-type domain-containing protein n=1 Tax=Paraglaciecola hydrolytica TaxID=1799789 RepID=A0A135ZZ79_9ALTE|nr:winged helix-turn-helix domain-containing protein [Paraglaciecola hydrolytica]KXI28288.1 hypothetical protein AX660_18120 [Paraglaciecola hydrolytica]
MIYQFDHFTLDTTQFRLTINGSLANDDIRIIRLLALIIQTSPNTCSKSTIREYIWPNTVVSDWSVSRLMADTRKLFKHYGYIGPLIQTVHGQGYRLDANLFDQLKGIELLTYSTPVYRKLNLMQKCGIKRPNILLITVLFGVAIFVGITTNYKLNANSVIYSESSTDVARILWVDDHHQNNQREQQYFVENNIAVYSVVSTEEAILLLKIYKYTAIISDMGRDSDPLAGIKLLDAIRETGITTPFYIYTIVSSPDLEVEVAKRDGQGVITQRTNLFSSVLNHVKQ